MQLLKIKGRLIAAAVFLVIGLLLAVVMGAGILVSILGGNEKQNQLNLELAGCTDSVNSGGSTSKGDPKPPADVAKEQEDIVRTIEKVVKEEGVDGRAVRVITIVGYGESTLTNLNRGDQDTGTRNPDGSLATSYGFLQQQTSMGWGTKEEVMDPAHATKSFLNGAGGNKGLLDFPGWQDMEPTEAANKVQKNQDPSYYVQYYSYADAVIKRAGVDTSFSGKTTKDGKEAKSNGSGGSGTGGTLNALACKKADKWNGDLGSGEWTAPCPGCQKASDYGPRSINGVDAGNGGMHYGVDLSSPGAGYGDGTQIITPVDMKVTELYEPDGCVFAVANSEPKFGFGFCHMNKIDVHAGQTLKRGDIIGTEGNKGDSVGSLFITHLHFEMYKPGANMKAWYEHKDNIDPTSILKKKGAWPDKASK